MEPDMPDKCEGTLTTFLKCVANVDTKISKSNFDLRGLDRKCRCAATNCHELEALHGNLRMLQEMVIAKMIVTLLLRSAPFHN